MAAAVGPAGMFEKHTFNPVCPDGIVPARAGACVSITVIVCIKSELVLLSGSVKFHVRTREYVFAHEPGVVISEAKLIVAVPQLSVAEGACASTAVRPVASLH